MSNASDFIIKNGVLKDYIGPGGDVIIPKGVTEIGYRAFAEHQSIQSVRIPEGVTQIGHSAFCGCNNLKTVILPITIKSFDTWWFMGCNSLEMIVSPGVPMGFYYNATISYYYADLAKTLKTAAAMGFLFHHEQYTEPAIATKYKEYIVAHKKEIIPQLLKRDAVEGITGYAALGKINQRNFESDFLKPAQAFGAAQCCAFLLEWQQKNLSKKPKDLEFNKALGDISDINTDVPQKWSTKKLSDDTVEIINYKGNETSITFPNRIGKKYVQRISYNGTCGCYDDLKEVTVSNNIKYIAPYTFQSKNQLERVTLPENITIGMYTFSFCHNLRQVVIPKSCVIEDWAFYKCKQLANAEGFAVLGETLVGYYGNETQIKLPENVCRIGAGAFKNCTEIDCIDLHDNVAQIGPAAFYGCEKLADRKGFVIVRNVLYDYFGKGGTITIPNGVTEISEDAFLRCKTLKNIIIPQSVKRIRSGAFSKCAQLESVSFPESDIEIDSKAFGLSRKLADSKNMVIVRNILFAVIPFHNTIKIPSYVKEIDAEVFTHDKNLRRVDISEGVTTIGDEAFRYCGNLMTIEIPKSVIQIGKNAFANCKVLTIHTPAGSYAEQYAKENNIPFVAE